MAETSNKEMIEKLERLQFLLNENIDCREYLSSGCMLKYSTEAEKARLTVFDLSGVPSVFKSFPVFAIDANEHILAKEKYEKNKKIFIVLCALSAVCATTYFGLNIAFLNKVAPLCIIATVIHYFMGFFRSKNVYKIKETAYSDSIKKSEQSMVAFKQALGAYETEKVAGIQAAKTFAEDYKNAYEKHKSIMIEYAESKKATEQKLAENMKEIQTFDFMPEEYYAFIVPVISMLKSGRADSFKEALNMAIEEDRQRRAEAARRAEEERKIRIMEEQAAAERRRAEELAHQQKIQEIRERNSQKQNDWNEKQATAKARREEVAAEAEARRKALRRCYKCKKRMSCPRGIPNCGAFDPE